MVRKTQRAEKKGVVLVNKGAWTANEDQKLMDYVAVHGDRKWRTLPAKAGLNRCGKSCRLRWLNYLRPGIKRGNISEDEEDLIIRLHNLIGNRWSLIAGRLPGRTDNEIKNHWNTHLCKKSLTLSDLNSKLNLKLEGSSSGSRSPSHTSFAPEPTSGSLAFPAETNRAAPDAHEHGKPAAPPELDRDTGVGRLEDYSIDAGFETCQSPSGMWFQPFSGEEYSGYDDLYMADMADYRDCLLYFP